MDKKAARYKRARRGRAKMRELGAVRLTVNRTLGTSTRRSLRPLEMRCLLRVDAGLKTCAVATPGTLMPPSSVGKLIAETRKAAGVSKVAFDRSGFKYHGRVKALADAAREGGLEF